MFPTAEAFWLSGQWPNAQACSGVLGAGRLGAFELGLAMLPRTGAANTSLGAAGSRALTAAARSGVAGSDFDATASRALTPVRTGTARSDLDAAATRTLFVAARSGTAYSDFDASATRTLLAAARSGTAITSLAATSTRALALASTGSVRSDFDAAGTRALILAARTSTAKTDLDASATRTVQAGGGASPVFIGELGRAQLGGLEFGYMPPSGVTPPPAVDTGGNAGGFVTQEMIDELPWPDWMRPRLVPTHSGAARLTLGATASRQIIETEDDAVILLLLG